MPRSLDYFLLSGGMDTFGVTVDVSSPLRHIRQSYVSRSVAASPVTTTD